MTETALVVSLQATSFGGSNLDPNAWEDKKSKGESRFPAQVGSLHADLQLCLPF
jgi:hypothetical protein